MPEELVRRIIKRESGGNPHVVSRGNYGLMQIKLPTARALGYSGGAAGLLDPETNMTYAVKYLAGACRVAHGNSNLAVHYYAAGYYYAVKARGMTGATKQAEHVAPAARAYASADTPTVRTFAPYCSASPRRCCSVSGRSPAAARPSRSAAARSRRPRQSRSE